MSSSTRMEPRLPPDLERDIFELDALENRRSVPRLLRVARRVKLWIEPLLYRVVFLSEGKAYPHGKVESDSENIVFTPLIMAAAIEQHPAWFFHTHARHLYIDCGAYSDPPTSIRFMDRDPMTPGERPGTPQERASMLAACTGVINVMLLNILEPQTLLPALSRMPLQQLQANLGSLFGDGADPAPVDFTVPLFANITHLAVFDDVTLRVTDWAQGLALLPRLTHVSFDFNGERRVPTPRPLFEAVLVHCTSLYVLVVLLTPDSGREALGLLVQHPRVAILDDHKTYDGGYDWYLGAHSRGDYWQRAETVITERRLTRA
ncbi:hypothetical protein B0H17DRAFT_1085256 [Mycena rosella]|uniref:Uncharacterized protein n=1 Tax=Mycena rosella TaxID=1033263 RepID=A0AAD7CZJ6_MYCRO|nr:hypothetical protein B0H17DRAFT_1085256 [Mycena rosella]